MRVGGGTRNALVTRFYCPRVRLARGAWPAVPAMPASKGPLAGSAPRRSASVRPVSIRALTRRVARSGTPSQRGFFNQQRGWVSQDLGSIGPRGTVSGGFRVTAKGHQRRLVLFWARPPSHLV